MQALYEELQSYPDAKGYLSVPSNVDDLIQTLEALYKQGQETVNAQRGAIVELLASKLVRERCEEGECFGNHRFLDGTYSSDQIDVAVLSMPTT